MPNGIKIATVSGIRINADYTWFLILILFSWSLAFGYFPIRQPGFDRGVYIAMGVMSAISLFVCVLIHELSHSITANRLGLSVRQITLFIFGGVAHLEKEPEDPMVEFKVAVAGPAASAALAIAFYAVSAITSPDTAAYAVFSYLALINTVLFVFNLVPGFPLDGGRILRALWWKKTGNLMQATRLASAIGRGFALFLIVTGLLRVLTGNFSGLWSVFIGVFLLQSARTGLMQLELKNALAGIKVSDVMSKNPITIDANLTVANVIENYFFRYHFISFPVIENGRPVGLLTLDGLRKISKENWETTKAAEAMAPIEPEIFLSPDDDINEAISRMSAAEIGRLPVVRNDIVVGIVSIRDIQKTVDMKRGFSDRP